MFDHVLGAGMYKKFLTQSNASGEEWASNVMDSVVKVQEVVSGIQELVSNIRSVQADGIDTNALAEACEEVNFCLQMHIVTCQHSCKCV